MQGSQCSKQQESRRVKSKQASKTDLKSACYEEIIPESKQMQECPREKCYKTIWRKQGNQLEKQESNQVIKFVTMDVRK